MNLSDQIKKPNLLIFAAIAGIAVTALIVVVIFEQNPSQSITPPQQTTSSSTQTTTPDISLLTDQEITNIIERYETYVPELFPSLVKTPIQLVERAIFPLEQGEYSVILQLGLDERRTNTKDPNQALTGGYQAGYGMKIEGKLTSFESLGFVGEITGGSLIEGVRKMTIDTPLVSDHAMVNGTLNEKQAAKKILESIASSNLPLNYLEYTLTHMAESGIKVSKIAPATTTRIIPGPQFDCKEITLVNDQGVDLSTKITLNAETEYHINTFNVCDSIAERTHFWRIAIAIKNVRNNIETYSIYDAQLTLQKVMQS